MSPCHLFLSSAAIFSWQFFVPLVVVMSVVQVFLGRPQDLLPSIFFPRLELSHYFSACAHPSQYYFLIGNLFRP